MKKIIILFTLLICICITGCSIKKERTNHLKTENNKVENIESINYIIEKDKSTEGLLSIIYLSYDNYENTDNVGKLNMIYNTYDIGMFKKFSKK